MSGLMIGERSSGGVGSIKLNASDEILVSTSSYNTDTSADDVNQVGYSVVRGAVVTIASHDTAVSVNMGLVGERFVLTNTGDAAEHDVWVRIGGVATVPAAPATPGNMFLLRFGKALVIDVNCEPGTTQLSVILATHGSTASTEIDVIAFGNSLT